MKKTTKRIIARIMAVMMIVSILPLDMWGSANMVMAEELSVTDVESSESAEADLAVEDGLVDTDNEEPAPALMEDTENPEDAGDTEETSVPEAADQTAGKEETPAPVEDAEVEADVENSEEGGALEETDALFLLDEEESEPVYAEEGTNNIKAGETRSFTGDQLYAEFSESGKNTLGADGTANAMKKITDDALLETYEKFTFYNKKGAPYLTQYDTSKGALKDEAGNIVTDDYKDKYKYEFGSASKFDTMSRIIGFYTEESAKVTICAYSTSSGRNVMIDRNEDGTAKYSFAAPSKVIKVTEDNIAKGQHYIWSDNNCFILSVKVEVESGDPVPSVTFTDKDGNPTPPTLTQTKTTGDAGTTRVDDELSLSSYTLTYDDGSGNTMTVESGNEKDASTVAWYRVGSASETDATNGTLIEGASGTSYTLTTEDVGKFIMAAVTPSVSGTDGETAYVVWENEVANVAGAPEPPTANKEEGVVEKDTLVRLLADGADAIYYTIDKPAPSVSEDGKSVSGTKYEDTEQIKIDKTLTIRAIAVKKNDENEYVGSGVATFKYTVAKLYTLDFSEYTTAQKVPFTAGMYMIGNTRDDKRGVIDTVGEDIAYKTGGGTTYNGNKGRLLAFKFPSGTETATVTIIAAGQGNTDTRYIALADEDCTLGTSASGIASAVLKDHVYGVYKNDYSSEKFTKSFTIENVDIRKEYALIMSNGFCIYKITVAAAGDIPKRTVTFYNGGTQVGDPQTVDECRTVTKPSVAPVDGKTFEGWYAEGSDTAFDFTKGVTADTTLYAKWTDITYNVTYYKNYPVGDVGEICDTQTVNYGENVTKPTDEPTLDGYRFSGWYTDAECSDSAAYTFGSTIDTDLELYAKWTKIIYRTVTYYLYSYENEGTEEVEQRKEVVEENDKVTEPEEPTREGYTFEGWYLDDEFTQEAKFPYTVENDVTFYAKWMGYAATPVIAPDTAKITQNTGITLTSTTENAVIYYTITINGTELNAEPTEYEGEFTLGNAVKEEDIVTITAIATAEGYNDSEPAAKRTYIIVSSEGYVDVPKTDVTPGPVDAGQKVSLSASDKSDNAVIYYTMDGETDPVTKAGESITIANGAKEFTEDEDITINHTTTIKAAAVLYDETDAEKETPKAVSAVVPFTYTVEEKKPEASPKSGPVDAGDKVTLSIPEGADKYSKDVEIYYTTDETASDTDFDEYTEEIRISEDTTVRAIAVYDGYKSDVVTFNYTLKKYTVTFNSGEGSAVEAQTVTSGQKAEKPDAPTRSEYAFVDWYTDEDCTKGNEYDFTEKVNDNITLYAKWDKLKSVLIKNTEWSFTTDGFGSWGLKTTGSTQLDASHDLGGITVGGAEKQVTAKPTDSKGSCLSVDIGGIIYLPISENTDAVQITITLQSNNSARYIYIGAGEKKETVYHSITGNVYVEGSPYFDNMIYTNKDLYLKSDGMFDTTLAIESNVGETKISKIILKEYRLVSENAEKYTVQFNTGEGSNVPDQGVVSGGIAAKPADPEREGYTFGGWYTDAACTESKKYNFATEVTADIILYAKWTAVSSTGSYTVQFNTNGGSTINDQSVVSGDKVTKPTNPTKLGNTFVGWYTDEDCTEEYDFTKEVTENITLYAKWTAVSSTGSYTVKFNTNGGSTIEDKGVESGGKVTKPTDPTKDGYTFEGWYTDAACTEKYDFETAVTGHITLYAKWTPVSSTETYTVHFDSKGGSEVAGQDIVSGDKATPPANPTKAGYSFGGWYTDEDCTNKYDFEAAVTEEITLYAKWTEISSTVKHTVQFNTNGGSTIDAINVASGDVATRPDDPEKAGYTFDGWYTDAACTEGNEYDFETAVTGNITLYAKWTPVSSTETYTVHFDSRGGSEVAGQDIVSGDKATPPANPTKAGYSFGGWYTDEDCTNKYDFEAAVTEEITLYAKWTEISSTVKHTVQFNTNGGSTINAINVASGDVATRPDDPEKDGYTFDGWYTDAACTEGNEYDFETAVTGNITLYAKWTPVSSTETYTVYFDSKGGSEVADQSIVSGDKATQPANPTKAGYSFGGWYTDEDCTNKYDFEAAVTEEITLYAKWTEISSTVKHTVQFNTNGGSTIDAINVASGDVATRPDDPEKSGYTFDGWYTDAACTEGNEYDFEAAVTEDIFLYAKWVRYAAKPYIDPATEEITSNTEITLTSATDGAVIYYTTDGEEPGTDATEYEGEFTLGDDVNVGYTVTIKAIATADGYEDSEVAERVYKIVSSENYVNVPKTDVTPETTVAAGTEVGLTADSGAVIFYTTDGETDPVTKAEDGSITITDGAIEYTAKITVEHTMTIKAAAVLYDEGTEEPKAVKAASAVVSFTYTVEERQLAKPAVSVDPAPVEGKIEKNAKITITAENEAAIYYTTDKSEPTVDPAKLYSAPITVDDSIITDNTVTIKAIAVKEGFKTSELQTVTFTVKTDSSNPDDEDDPNNNEGLKVTFVKGTHYTYTGSQIIPAIVVRNNGRRLTEGVDYTVKYSNNVKVTPGATQAERDSAEDKKKAKVTVTGKGNLAGKQDGYFVIDPVDIGENTNVVKAGSLVVAENAKAVPVLVHGGYKLGAKDFDIITEGTFDKDKNHKWTTAESGSKIRVQGKGNYAGIRDITVTVKAKKDLKSLKVTVNTPKMDYTGGPQHPEIEVNDKKDKAATLTEGTNYMVVWPDDETCTNAGKISFSVIGMGDYYGSVTAKYTINPDKSGANITISGGPDAKGYPFVSTGVTIDDAFKLTYAAKAANGSTTNKDMVIGRDYKITYSNNKKVGEAKYTISFIGSYKGTTSAGGSVPMKGTFNITQCMLNDANKKANDIKVVAADKVYSKPGEYKSAPYITVGKDCALVKASDYKVTYHHKNADGSIGDEINKRTAPLTFEGAADDDLYKTVIVKIVAKPNKNYVSSTGNTEGYLTTEFKVWRQAAETQYDLTKAKVTVVDDTKAKLKNVEYTGKETHPNVKIEVKSGKTFVDIDTLLTTDAEKKSFYDSIVYVNNVNKGKATIVINGDGTKFVGSKTATYSIVACKLNNVTDLFKK